METLKESEAKTRVIQYIIKSLEEGADVVRCSSAKAVGKMGIMDAVEPLIGCLEDNDPDLRYDAALALGQLGDKRAVKPLTQILDDEDPEVIKCAIDSLAKLKDKEAVDSLINALELDKDFSFIETDDNLQLNLNFEIHEKAVEALGELGDQKAVKPLIDFIKDDPVFDIIEAALVSLAKIGADVGMKKIEETLKDSDPIVKRRGVRALIKSECPELSEKLTDLLIDEDNEVKLISMDALSTVANKNGKAPVPLVLLLQDKNREVQMKAAETVGNIMGEKAVSHLIPLLGESDATARARVVELLGDIGSEEAVDPLIVLLQDEKDVTVIEEAVTSLGKIGGTDAFKCLMGLLSDKESSKDDSLEKRLIYAIGSIKNQESMSVLIDILKRGDESDINKNIAVDMLNGFKDEEIAELLKETVEEAEERKRQALEAAKEDAEKGGKNDEASVIDEKGESEGEEKKAAVSSEMAEKVSGIEETVAEVEEEEEEVKPDFKVWAAMALKGNKSHVSKELLYSLLEDDDPQVSKEAAISLASMGEEQALNTLVPERPTKESMVELGVLESVASIDGPQADEILLAFLDNQNGDIRYFTLKAIGGKYRSDTIFQKVLTLLQDNIDIVKQEAVVTLGNMKHPEAVEPLVSLLFSSDAGDYLHDEIIKALHKLDNKEASDMILYGLTDCEECVIQSRAIEVLTELNLNA